MKVLHYISSTLMAQQAEQFAALLHSSEMEKTLENTVISKGGIMAFRQAVKTTAPDIVHIHGCWNLKGAIAQSIARRAGIPVIISPQGELSPRIVQTNFWKEKLPKILLFQFRQIRKATALHAATPTEVSDLKELGWRKRIALIDITDHTLAAQELRRLYQKAIDTCQRNHLSPAQRSAIYQLLYYATTNDPSEPANDLSQLTAHDWKVIQVYALDHNVLDIITQGAERAGIQINEHVTTPPSRYSHKSPFTIVNTDKLAASIRLNYPEQPSEQAIATTITELYMMTCKRHVLTTSTTPLRLLTDIYRLLSTTDYDEQVLLSMLRSVHLTTFTARLMNILQEQFRLTIGFMPLDPKGGRKTRRLFTYINNLP